MVPADRVRDLLREFLRFGCQLVDECPEIVHLCRSPSQPRDARRFPRSEALEIAGCDPCGDVRALSGFCESSTREGTDCFEAPIASVVGGGIHRHE